MTILEEAQKTVVERASSYDHPRENFKRIASLWNIYLKARGIDATLTEKDVGMFMILTKIAREVHAHKRDNLVDIAGYAHCIEEL